MLQGGRDAVGQGGGGFASAGAGGVGVLGTVQGVTARAGSKFCRAAGWLSVPSAGCCVTNRLVRDYERRPEHHEAMVLWATVIIMTRELQQETSSASPAHPARSGRPRTGPPEPIQQAA